MSEPAEIMRSQTQPKNIIMCLSPGRCGTKLLTKLMALAENTCAQHEEPPYFQDFTEVTRPSREAAEDFIRDVKYPHILNHDEANYIEASHMFGKGFFEIFLAQSIPFKLILLHREPRDVAKSHWRIKAIPGRRASKRQFLLHPDMETVMPLPGWARMSDYQLCYWYCLEIERRKEMYRKQAEENGLKVVDVQLSDLLDYARFAEKTAALGLTLPDGAEAEHAAITGRKVNRKAKYLPKIPLIPYAWQEKKVWRALGTEGAALYPVLAARYGWKDADASGIF